MCVATKSRRRERVTAIALTVCLTACLSVLFLIIGYQQHWSEDVRDENALHQVTDMIVHFVLASPEKVPASWEDLYSSFIVVNRGYNVQGIDELQRRVNVDFENLRKIYQAPRRQFAATPRFLSTKCNDGSAQATPAEDSVNRRILRLFTVSRDNH